MKIFTGIQVAAVVMLTQLAFGQKKYDVGIFHQIEATDKIQVELIASDQNLVTLEGQNYENAEVVNTNGSLRLKMNTLNMMQGGEIQAKVYYKGNLTSLSAKKGSKLIARPNAFVPAAALQINASEGGLVDIGVKADKLNVKITSGSVVALHGTTGAQDVISNFGGKYEAKELKSDFSTVTVNAGGKADVYAKKSVTAKTRGGGVIRVYGNPAQQNQKAIAGGVIEFVK